MKDLKNEASICWLKQIDPETSEFECFFHYTDYKIFEAGFEKGYEHFIETLPSDDDIKADLQDWLLEERSLSVEVHSYNGSEIHWRVEIYEFVSDKERKRIWVDKVKDKLSPPREFKTRGEALEYGLNVAMGVIPAGKLATIKTLD